MSSIPKPELRGHLNRYIRKSMILAFLGSGLVGTLYYFCYMEPRKRAIAEFYRTYDIKEHVRFLKKHGYLQSVKM